MPTLAAAKQALGYAASGFLVPLRAELALAGLIVPGLTDPFLYPAAVAAGLSACGAYAADPTAPTQGDLDTLAAADWQKFLTFGGLYVLELAAATAAVMPDQKDYGSGEDRTGWDRTALIKLLEMRRKAAGILYPGVPVNARPMTVAWLSVGGDAATSEF